MQVCASNNTKGLKRVWKRRVRLARKTLTLSCLIPAVLARDCTCLVFIKDRRVSSLRVVVFEFLGSSFSSFWVFRFRDLGASFSIGASFSRFRCFVFEFWVLRFRDLGASFSSLGAWFSSFGCLVFEIWVLRFSVFVFECFVFRTVRTLTLV